MAGNKDDDRWGNEGRDSKKGRLERGRNPQQPPYLRVIFWLLVIVGVPLVVWMVNPKNKPKAVYSDSFMLALAKNRVKKLEVHHQDGSSQAEAVGEMLNDAGESVKYRVIVEYDNSFKKQVKDGVEQGYIKSYRYVPKNSFLPTLISFFLPFILVLALIYFLFSRQMKNAGRGAMQFGKSRARLAQNLERVTFKDVAGVDNAREEVVEIVEYLRDPGRFHKLGGRIPHGVLLVGPPGTGKTLLARAIAGEAEVPFFTISGSDFVEMFVGVGASRVRDMFEQAKRNSPCIIFIDEIDAVGRSRFSGVGGGHDEREQTLNALLVEMDGFEANSGVIVIAATNRPDVLDKALLRPGRFDRQVHVELPDLVGRKEIIQVHIKKIKVADIDLDQLARSTPGFSGADIENLINEAALTAARNGKEHVELDDFEEARDKVMFGKERPWRAMSKKDRRMTACHEAGHALVSIYCNKADPLHKVSIIPRGKMLGGAMYFPEGDKVSQSRSELLDRMVIGAGGRCAEELVFSELNSGAYGDIRQVSQIARAMVMQLGMSEKLGFIEYAHSDEDLGYLGHLSKPDYSEETARSIDAEVRSLVDAAMTRATELLTEHRDQLDALTEALLDKETLSAEEVYDLFGMPMPERLKLSLQSKKPKKKGSSQSERDDDADDEEKIDDTTQMTPETVSVSQEADEKEETNSDEPEGEAEEEAEADEKEEESSAEPEKEGYKAAPGSRKKDEPLSDSAGAAD